MGIKTLRKLQMGKEATPGTAVAATSLWRGMGVLNDEQELQFIEEDIGVLAQPDAAYIPQLISGVTFEDVDASFEQICYVFTAGVKKIESGTADGGGTGYIYNYTMPTTTANTISTLTFEGGDDEGAEEVNYCFVKEFAVSGAAGEAVKVSAEWTGRSSTVTTFTGSIAVPTTEIILFNKGKVWIDPVGNNYGTTLCDETVLDFEVSVTTGWIPRWTLDGSKYFTFVRATRPEFTLTMTMEHNTHAVAEKAAMRAGTMRRIRLQFEGSALGTPGSYTYKTFRMDLPVKWTAVPSMDDEDGDDTLEFEGNVLYDTAGSAAGLFLVVNENGTLA